MLDEGTQGKARASLSLNDAGLEGFTKVIAKPSLTRAPAHKTSFFFFDSLTFFFFFTPLKTHTHTHTHTSARAHHLLCEFALLRGGR